MSNEPAMPNPGATAQGAAKMVPQGGMPGDQVAPGSRPDMHPGDELPPGAPNAGENYCLACGGSGRLKGGPCHTCGGTGKVIESVAGGP